MNNQNGLRETHVNRQRTNRANFLLPALAAAGALLGFVGFAMAFQSRPPLEMVIYSISGTAQLFLLGVDQMRLVNWPLRIASLLAPAATATVVWTVFATTIHRWWLRTRHKYRSPGVVFLGGGNVAQRIANSADFFAAGSARCLVVDLEPVAQLPGWSSVPSKFSFLVGSALDRETLITAGAHKAKHVWIATGDDRRNLEILHALHELECNSTSRRTAGAARDWFVDVTDRDLLRYVSRLEENWRKQPGSENIDTHPISLERMAAREIMNFCLHTPLGSDNPSPATRVWESLSEDSGFHFAIVGGGVQAEEILLHAIHFLIVDESPNHAPRISWFGPEVSDRVRQLQMSFPVLKMQDNPPQGLADVLPVAKINTFDTSASSVSLHQWQRAQQEQAFNAVIVVPNGEVSENVWLQDTVLQLAVRDQDSGRAIAPIVLVADRTSSFSFEEGHAKPYQIKPLESLWKSGEEYPGQGYDEQAKLVHAEYMEKEQAPPQEITKLWKEAKEYERWSSRYASDHREIHRTLARRGKDAESLARIEHRRYVVERLLEGWLPKAGPKLREHRLHPDLTPWNDGLDESSKARTRGTVQKILRIKL